MFTKLLIVAATAVAIAARPQDHHAGHAYSSQSILLHAGGEHQAAHNQYAHDAGNHGDHGHAYSSQSIVLHHAKPHHVEQHYGHELQAAHDNHGHAYSSQNIVLSHGDEHNVGSIHNLHSDDHHQAGHGHAYSSQNIVLHHAHNVPVVHHQKSGHHQNVILQNAHEAVHFVPTVTVQHHDDGHHYGHASSGQHLLQGHEAKHVVEHYAHPKYEFVYKVADPHTGDFKSHHEARDGDVVKGVYSLHEADGTTRIVEYHADKHSGFNAVVKHEGHAKHIVAANNYHH